MDIVGVTPLPARLEMEQVVEVELSATQYANLRNYFKPELITSSEPDPPEQPTDPEWPPENPEPAKKPRGRPPKKTAEPKPTE
jgi:hypothetical protein